MGPSLLNILVKDKDVFFGFSRDLLLQAISNFLRLGGSLKMHSDLDKLSGRCQANGTDLNVDKHKVYLKCSLIGKMLEASTVIRDLVAIRLLCSSLLTLHLCLVFHRLKMKVKFLIFFPWIPGNIQRKIKTRLDY